MSAKKKDIRDALVEGATQGLFGKRLYGFVRSECPGAKNKKIVNAAFLTLSDSSIRERKILDVIYSLALERRLGEDEADSPQDGAAGEQDTGKAAGA